MTDTATPVRMKDYGVFEATRTLPMPRGWLIPAPHVEAGRYAAAIERLRLHGLVLQRVAAPAQIDVERFVIARMTRAEQTFQGHREVRLSGKYTLREAVGAGRRDLHSRRAAAGAARVLSARARERRRTGDVELHGCGPRGGRDVSDLSRAESGGAEARSVRPYFQLSLSLRESSLHFE